MTERNTTIRSNGRTFINPRLTIIGNHNVVNGMMCIIKGNHNVINGMKCVVEGNHNCVTGMMCTVKGNHNTSSGMMANVSGNNNRQQNPTTLSIPNIQSDRRKRTRSISINNIGILGTVGTVTMNITSGGVSMNVGRTNKHKVTVVKKEKKEKSVKVPLDADRKHDRDLPDDEDGCVVCLDRKNNCIALPCGHKCICITCGIRLGKGKKRKNTKCPQCRAKVNQVKRVFE